MLYVVSGDIDSGIHHVLQMIDKQFSKTNYINCTLPGRLFNLVNNRHYNFKSPEKLRLFNYQKVNDLKQLHDFFNGLRSENGKEYVVIESISDIVKLTALDYPQLNALIMEIMIALKASGKQVFLIDQKYNQFIDLSCDDTIHV